MIVRRYLILTAVVTQSIELESCAGHRLNDISCDLVACKRGACDMEAVDRACDKPHEHFSAQRISWFCKIGPAELVFTDIVMTTRGRIETSATWSRPPVR